MYRLLPGLLALALVVPAVLAEEAPKPGEGFKKLQQEFIAEVGKAKTPEARKELFEKVSARFLAFAEKNAKDPSAFDALVFTVQLGQGNVGKDTSAGKALVVLKQAHVKSKRAAEAVGVVALLGGEAGTQYAKDVIENNPERKVQVKAVKALIKAREWLIQLAGQLKGNDAQREQMEKQLGKEFVKNVMDNVETYQKENKEYAKLLTDKYSDLTVDLSVGKKAPEVVSQDLNGKKVKLSDLRGKVVVLDVWATWCPPCRGMIPHERELVKRLKDKPFVLVSISADAKKETLTDFLKKEPMPWTHWWNGATGGMVADWEVEAFPTIYVLDDKGVIRSKFVGAVDKELDKAVDALLKEVEGAKKKS